MTVTFTFKLSRRLARLRAASIMLAGLIGGACGSDQSMGPGSPASDPTKVSIIPDSVSVGTAKTLQFSATMDGSTEPLSAVRGGKGRGRWLRTVVDLAIAPDTVAVAEGMGARFAVAATLSDGSTSMPSVTWTATGGKIDATGKFIAGPIPGDFTITATAANGVADTAVVIVTEVQPIAVEVALSPSSVSLPIGDSKQFIAVGKANDGTTVAVSPKYVATGGTISADGVYQAGQTPGTFRVIATDTATNLADTSTVTVQAQPATVQAVVINPATASLDVGQSKQFTASARMSDGTTSSITVTWATSGGTISSEGLYEAGSAAGSYRVIATQSGGSLADTAAVTVSEATPTLDAVVLTPASVTLESGATKQFAVSGRLSDGSTTTVNATFRATGGTITSAGLYIADNSPGVFQVIATEQGSMKADTSSVTVTSSSAGSPGCAPGTLQQVPVSTVGELTAALGAANPGDCIVLAAGTYSLANGYTMTRNGTAANPITVVGPRSSWPTRTAIIDVNKTGFQVEADHVHWRRIRWTDFGLSGLWFRNSAIYNVLDSIEVDNSLQWLLTFKNASHHNVVKHSLFHDSGKGEHPEFGEAIYISNSGNPGYPLEFTNTDNQILNNHFGPNVRSMAVILSEGADRTTVRGNVIDGTGAVFVPGFRALIVSFANDGIFESNTMRYGKPDGITFYAPSTRTMKGNVVSNNTVDLRNIHNVDMAYYGFQLTVNTNSPDRVTVKCNNTVINGPFSNVPCTP